VPWFYITSVFTGGAASIRKYSHLVTKIRFPVSVIPTFTSMSHLVTNGIMTLIVMLIFIAMGYWPDLYWLQLPLYFVMMFVFFTVWALFAGMLSVISKDFLHLVQSSTTALFWMSGIMYDVSGINSPVLQAIMLYNPVTLIVNGYRNCFIHKVWFWENPVELRNYFIVLAIMMVLAVRTYKKLFRSIADVL
jgi:teichoic acid transport system permease protein